MRGRLGTRNTFKEFQVISRQCCSNGRWLARPTKRAMSMRGVCEKYAQSHEKHARRPCTTFASKRLAGKELQKDPETIFEGFNESHRILRDSGAVPKDVKQFKRIPRDWKESQKILKNFKGSQRPSTPMQRICSFSSLFSSPS